MPERKLRPTLWFSCWLMNLITFVSACCCVQEGLFGSSEPCVGRTLSVCTLFGLVLSLASADSPVWGYLTADCREHGVFHPSLPCPYLLLISLLFPCTACTQMKTRQPF